MKHRIALLALLATGFLSSAFAGEVDVVEARAEKAPDGSYTFNVTLRHADEGWKHYADRWEILTPDNEVIATRVLHHPHVKEQPFTRGLSGVVIPSGITQVIIRGHDSVHGYKGRTYALKIR